MFFFEVNPFFRLHDLFQDVSLDLDDEVYIYLMDTKTKLSHSYRLYEVYKIHHDGHPVINNLGNWSLGDCKLYFVQTNKNSRRHDLRVRIPFDNNMNIFAIFIMLSPGSHCEGYNTS